MLDSFEAGTFPNGWTLEAASIKGKRLLAGGFRGAGLYQLFPASGTAHSPSLLYRYTAAAFAAAFGKDDEPGDLRPGTDYRLNVAAACVAAGGGKLRLQVDVYDSTPTLIQEVITEIVLGTALPADGVWRMARSTAIRLTPSQAARVSYVDLRLVCLPVAGTYTADVDLRFDFVTFGALLDTNELGRCSPEDPFEADKEGLFDDEMSTARTPFRVSFHTGINAGIFTVRGIQPGGEREVTNFFRAAGGGRPMSVMYDLTELSKDYYPLAIYDGDTDGLEQGIGAYADASIPWRETVAP